MGTPRQDFAIYTQSKGSTAILAGFLLWVGLLVPLKPACAAETVTLTPRQALVAGPHWWGFGGVDLGLGLLSGSGIESEKSGYQVDFIGKLAYYGVESWIFDLGAGWQYANLSGKRASGADVNVRLRAFMADLSAHYVLTEKWRIGLASNYLLGTDTSFSELVIAPGTEKRLAVYVGPSAFYEFPWGPFRTRLQARVLTDLNIGDRQVYWFQLGFHIGLPFSAGSDRVVATTTTTTTVETTIDTNEDTITVDKDTVRLVLRSKQLLHFNTAKHTLVPTSVEFVRELSDYLAKNDQWKSLRIEGHTDDRGSFKYNMQLSGARVATVRDLMVGRGVGGEKIEAIGYGPSRPLDTAKNEVAWAKNRRVELFFTKVIDPTALSVELTRLRNKYFGRNKSDLNKNEQ